ncbi:hypothetical protein EU527_17610 [Candidatus Thorarchaeota archaeon]|nr:MAG: hypothetical protein EU527_17610 [Candidatus Thorarchaeota archaeon]
MRANVVRTVRFALLASCLILFFQPVVTAQIVSTSFEPLTDDSKQWTFQFLNQRIGYDHIYGNFSLRVTFSEPVEYVIFNIFETEIIDDVEYTATYIIANVTSEPYECNFSTLDYSIGVHWVNQLVCYVPNSGVRGGGNRYFFEHQDKSGDQILYTRASAAVLAAIVATIFGADFAVYNLGKWYLSRPRPSRFER